MHDDLDFNMHPDHDFNRICSGDQCDPWTLSSNFEVVMQWELMAKDGLITEEDAARRIAADTAFAKAELARRRPSRMSPVNRLRFMRTLSLYGLAGDDLAPVRTNPGFAQLLID